MTRAKWVQWVLPLAAGALAAAAMPGVNAGPVLFVALIPLLREVAEGRGFRAGLLFGVAFFAIDLHWILTLIQFTPLVIPGLALLVLYLALTVGLLGLLLSWLRRRCGDVRWALAVVAGFAGLEFLRSLGPLGFTFSSFYLALHNIPQAVQLAAHAGSFAITACIVAVNVSIYLAVRRRKARCAIGAVAALGVLFLPALAPVPPDSGPQERVAVISSLVGQEAKLDSRNMETLLARYGRLADEAVAADPDLVVFPESFLPAYILRNPTALARLQAVAREGSADVVFGTGDIRDGNWYNCVVLLDASGDVAASYDMVRPVPFGEYVPGRQLWAALGAGPLMESSLPEDLTAGRDQRPLRGIATPICFESTFSRGSRDLVRHGGRLIVTVTNDAWFALSSQREAHFAFAVFRAVENRRWMVQSANGGISGVVSPTGRVVAFTRDEGVVVAQLAERTDRSLYSLWGDAPALSLCAAGLLAALPARRKPKAKT